MNRLPEVEILPACEYYGLGVVHYSPLARGVLTGKYQPGKAPPKGRRAGRQDRRVLESGCRPESRARAQKLKAHAEAKGLHPPDVATHLGLANAYIHPGLARATTADQLKS